MNKNTIIKTLVLIILLILFSFSIKASIFATIGNIGGELALSFVDSGIANTIKTVQSVAGMANPQAYITSKISGEVMGQIMQQLPTEAQQAIAQYNKVKGWVDEGAKITEDLKLDSKGGLAGGSLELNNKEQDMAQIIDPENKDLSVKAANMKIMAKEEGGDITLTAKEGGYVIIDGKKYGNLKDGSKMVMARNGGVKEADFTFTEKTTVELGRVNYEVPKDGRLVYKDGVAEISTKPWETVKINDQEIKIGEGSIKYEGGKITGKDFTIDEKRFTGVGDKLAEVKVVDEGYLMGKNTIMEDNRMTLTSEKGDILYSKMCGDVSGFDNYVNPCRKTLTMEGEGFSVQLKEGKQFGLEIEKDDMLKYSLNGGKVVLDNGGQIIIPSKDGYIRVINGDLVTKYVEIDGEVQALVDPETIGGDIDVSMTTSYDESQLEALVDEETDLERTYACPVDTGATTRAVTDITTLAGFKCQGVVVLGGKNNILTDKQIIGMKWGEDTVTKLYLVQKYVDPTTGKVSYGRIVETIGPNGLAQTFITSDGKGYAISITGRPAEHQYDISEKDLKSFGLTSTKNPAPTAAEAGITWKSESSSTLTNKEKSWEEKAIKVLSGGKTSGQGYTFGRIGIGSPGIPVLQSGKPVDWVKRVSSDTYVSAQDYSTTYKLVNGKLIKQ